MSDTEADGSDPIDAELVEDDAAVTAPSAISSEVPGLDYTNAGVPTFDYVRDRIEKRATTATGETELAGLGTDHDIASLDKQLEERDKAAKDKLAEIRRSMRQE